MKFIFGLMANKFTCAFATTMGVAVGIMFSMTIWAAVAEQMSR